MMEKIQVNILISIVCYDNEKEVVKFIEQLEQQQCKENIAVVLTINQSRDVDSLKSKLENKSIKVYIENPGGNLGYLHGCLYGLKKIRNIIEFEWCIICNTDLIFQDSQFFKTFINDKFDHEI